MHPGKFIFLTLIPLIACQDAMASWIYVPLHDLVAKSDAIVVGPLTDIQFNGDFSARLRQIKKRVLHYNDYDSSYTGYIVVDKVLAGNVKAGDRLKFMCYSPDYPSYLMNSAIWLLIKKGNHFEAYHSGYRPLSDEAEIVQLLHEPVTLLSASYEHAAGADIPLRLRVRNTGVSPMTFRRPDVSQACDVTTTGTNPVKVLIRFQNDQRSTGTLTIGAHKEVYFPLALNKFIRVESDKRYEIKAAVEGFPVSSRLELRILRK